MRRSNLSYFWTLFVCIVGRMMVFFRKVGKVRGVGGDGSEEEGMGEGKLFLNYFKKF